MGRGLSELQKRILTAAIQGRAQAVDKMPGAGIGQFEVLLNVPLPADVVLEYTDALARYRRWSKSSARMRLEIAQEHQTKALGRHESQGAYPDDVVLVMRCGLHFAVDRIGDACYKIRRCLFEALPDENTREGTPNLHCRCPSCVFCYSFENKSEADAFRDRHSNTISNLADRPGATLEVIALNFETFPDLLVRDAVLLAGDGERTGSAEAVASRAIARLEHRGLVETGRATEWRLWRPRALWLTESGLAVARGIAPEIASAIDGRIQKHIDDQAAETARRIAERETRSPEKEAEANDALEALQSVLALFRG